LLAELFTFLSSPFQSSHHLHSARPSPPVSLPPLLPPSGAGLEIINSVLPTWLSKEGADDDKLTKAEFEGRYIQQMTLTDMPSPSQKEIELHYQLYSAKHKGEGTFMKWICSARDGEIDGQESDAAFQYLQGKILDCFHGRGTCAGGEVSGKHATTPALTPA
jgi:hypothetical protein